MNISEANAVNTVLSWVTALSLYEVDSSVDHPTGDELVTAAQFLAGRAHAALGAGPTGDEVAAQVQLTLDES